MKPVISTPDQLHAKLRTCGISDRPDLLADAIVVCSRQLSQDLVHTLKTNLDILETGGRSATDGEILTSLTSIFGSAFVGAADLPAEYRHAILEGVINGLTLEKPRLVEQMQEQSNATEEGK